MTAEGKIVRDRLVQWNRWKLQPIKIHTRLSSPNGRIVDEKNAAGSHGDGIRYEIIDGVSCPPDGGLAREMERRARAWGFDMRCRETEKAIGMLPDRMREAIRIKFSVPLKETPRSTREVARQLDRDESTVREALNDAYERIYTEIYGSFEVVADAEDLDTTQEVAANPARDNNRPMLPSDCR